MYTQQIRTRADIRRHMWQSAIREALQTSTSGKAWRPEPGLSEQEIANLMNGQRYDDDPGARQRRG